MLTALINIKLVIVLYIHIEHIHLHTHTHNVHTLQSVFTYQKLFVFNKFTHGEEERLWKIIKQGVEGRLQKKQQWKDSLWGFPLFVIVLITFWWVKMSTDALILKIFFPGVGVRLKWWYSLIYTTSHRKSAMLFLKIRSE